MRGIGGTIAVMAETPTPPLVRAQDEVAELLSDLIRIDIDGNVLEDAYQALLGVGHSPLEARNRLDRILAGGRDFKSVEEMLVEIYKQE